MLVLIAGPLAAKSIIDSKHNLSAGGPGSVKAATESQVCIFCHTPHTASPEAPLWNRYNNSGTLYTPYTSTTTKAAIGQPTGSSRLCLSCHDGTVALGHVLSRTTDIPMAGGVTTMPVGNTGRLETDLRNDHPISFTYNAALVTARGELKDPSTLTGAVHLENGQVQCGTCHDAHDDQWGDFLVMSNTASSLCVQCHDKADWALTSHSTSTKTWNGSGPDPWPRTDPTTVAGNACESCHSPHNGGAQQRLLASAAEESNCYPCHNGNVAATNIQLEFSKSSVHPVASTTGTHDPLENLINPTRHVECIDCHNPHAANQQTATVPAASGALAKVKGVNAAGTAVSPLLNEYELCFRCHADSTDRGPALITREFVQTNTRLDFQSSNASYHPVLAVGKNPDVPGLISPWTTTSLMYCTDCHNNDQGPGAGGAGPKGPHGSIYPPLLERKYDFTDNVPESAELFALCYKCHDRTTLMATGGFKHSSHMSSGGSMSPCSTCHDPHGVASRPHLLNFNTSIVTPFNGTLLWTDTGVRSGECTLVCHGTVHRPKRY